MKSLALKVIFKSSIFSPCFGVCFKYCSTWSVIYLNLFTPASSFIMVLF